MQMNPKTIADKTWLSCKKLELDDLIFSFDDVWNLVNYIKSTRFDYS